MPPFYNDEPPRTTDADDSSSASILSHKTISYIKIETKVADAETLSTRLLEDDIISDDDDVDDDEHLFCVSSFDSHRPFMILSCFYMFLVTTNIIILSSSTEDFDSDNWWKVSNICNVVSGYLGIMAAMYRSKVAVALVSGWWLFEMFFGMFRLACMYWSIIPNTPVRSWFIAYTVISYIVRLMLVGSASMFVAQKYNNGEQTDLTFQRMDSNDGGAQVVFV